MSKTEIRPYGSWSSPLTAEDVASAAIGLESVQLEGASTYWVEMRPEEDGRYFLVERTAAGENKDLTMKEFNVRTRVHEYGGGAYLMREGTVYFSNFKDQRIYRQEGGANPKPISPEIPFRYADYVYDEDRDRLICVGEDHQPKEPENKLVSVSARGQAGPKTLVSGEDFYASPRLSAEGEKLAWISWNHPNMPWDGTFLWTAKVREDGSLGPAELIAGGEEESVIQPRWSPRGVLHFISDRDGWWQLFKDRGQGAEKLTEKEAEFGKPQWQFGTSTYAFLEEGRIVSAYKEGGRWNLALIEGGELEPLDTSYTNISSLRAAEDRVVFIGGSPREETSVVELDLRSGETEVLRRSSSLPLGEELISAPQALSFPSKHGDQAHGFFYPPHNPDFRGPEDEQPPLIVKSHGGPTAASSDTLSGDIQFWTSRGFAVLDVNYGGSTGYGREYRKRLEGKWGIVDVDDCVSGALYLVDRGEVDGERLMIKGGSAGGYTTLSALTFRDVFRAGASYYGVSDLGKLVEGTHKFESRYLERLIGPYPEREDLYRQRSPLFHVEELDCPVIFLQGTEDKVVPPEQAEKMVDSLLEKGLPVGYVTFEGEQHGFRKASSRRRALQAELYFYCQVFGIKAADEFPQPPVKIKNLNEEG